MILVPMFASVLFVVAVSDVSSWCIVIIVCICIFFLDLIVELAL